LIVVPALARRGVEPDTRQDVKALIGGDAIRNQLCLFRRQIVCRFLPRLKGWYRSLHTARTTIGTGIDYDEWDSALTM